MVPKVNVLAHSTQFIFLTIRLVPENVIMVAITNCGNSPSRGVDIWKFVKTCINFYVFCLLNRLACNAKSFAITFLFSRLSSSPQCFWTDCGKF